MLCWMSPPGFRIQTSRVGPIGLTELVHLSIGYCRPHGPAQCNYDTGRCHASVFQQYYPARKRLCYAKARSRVMGRLFQASTHDEDHPERLLIGSGNLLAADVCGLLVRNGHPYSYIDLERDADVQNLLD